MQFKLRVETLAKQPQCALNWVLGTVAIWFSATLAGVLHQECKETVKLHHNHRLL